MSYDISLCDPVSREVLLSETPHTIRGGTYAMGGTQRLWLNVTYNYAVHFHRIFAAYEDQSLPPEKREKGIRTLYGKTGAESIPILKAVIAQLGDDVDPDYWKPTEGNAKRALYGLLSFAQIRPDGIWDGD